MSSVLREHHRQIVAELADTAMALARDIAEKALKAEGVEETIQLAAAYERAARSVRLSVGLCEKLDRDDARAAREAEELGRSPKDVARRRQLDDRAALVRAAVRRSIRQETEGERAERLEAALDLLIEECRLDPRFAVQPLNDLASALRASLGFPRDLEIELPDEACPP